MPNHTGLNHTKKPDSSLRKFFLFLTLVNLPAVISSPQHSAKTPPGPILTSNTSAEPPPTPSLPYGLEKFKELIALYPELQRVFTVIAYIYALILLLKNVLDQGKKSIAFDALDTIVVNDFENCLKSGDKLEIIEQLGKEGTFRTSEQDLLVNRAYKDYEICITSLRENMLRWFKEFSLEFPSESVKEVNKFLDDLGEAIKYKQDPEKLWRDLLVIKNTIKQATKNSYIQ